MSSLGSRERSPQRERVSSRHDTRSRGEDRKWPHDHDRRQQRHDSSYHGERHEQHRSGRNSRSARAPFKPDHVKNPFKWTKYDLTDDGTRELRKSGMSADQVNKYAAFEFLNTLKKKEDVKDEAEVISEGGKVVFKKPTRREEKETAKVPAVRDGGGFGAGAGVRIMEKYEVGGEKVKEGKSGRTRRKQLTVLGGEEEESDDAQRRSRSAKQSHQGISLSHLEETDEVDDT